MKNLAATRALAVANADGMADYGLDFGLDLEKLDVKVLAYAFKHDVVLPTILNIEKCLQRESDKARASSLPEYDANENNHWGWTKTLKKYTPAGIEKKMDGDTYDVTSWTATKRKKHSSHKGKDPLLKDMMENTKKQMILSLAEQLSGSPNQKAVHLRCGSVIVHVSIQRASFGLRTLFQYGKVSC